MRVYFAGPLFTTAEREFNASVVERLRLLGHEVFLPQETEQQNTGALNIFLGDVAGIDWCEVVVGNMDGPDPDSGTCWECGSVFRRKPVILYRTDIRNEEPFGPFNLMLHQAAIKTLDCKWKSSEEVAAIIHKALEASHDND